MAEKQKPQSKHKMDERCPRQLESTPKTWCPLAVQRLKALRHAGKELSEEEEALLPGCPFAVNHQLANYCFFQLAANYLPDKPLSDMEIAHINNLSVETVRKLEKQALAKIRKTESFKEVIDEYGDDKILDELDGETEWESPI